MGKEQVYASIEQTEDNGYEVVINAKNGKELVRQSGLVAEDDAHNYIKMFEDTYEFLEIKQ